MAETLHFDDASGVEIVRHVVFRRLREDRTWSQFGAYDASAFAPYIEIPSNLRTRFLVLVNEVMWELIIERVITPGSDSANPELPFFRITDYGHKVFAADKFVPHDPTAYLAEVRAVARRHVRDVAFAYLTEALQCFTRGCPMAATLLLGVAAEAVFLDLCRVVERSIRDKSEQAKFAKLTWVREKHRWVLEKYENLPAAQRKKLPDSLSLTLGSLYDLIRRQRNEVGHPQEKPPTVGRDLAFVMFQMFPTFVVDVEAFAGFCRKHGI